MRKTALAGLAVTASIAATAGQAATCADRTHVVNALETRFGEQLVANARSSRGAVLQVFSTPDAATWSIIVQLPERQLACLAATGKGKTDLDRILALY